MARDKLKIRSSYVASCIVLTTKHAKSIAIQPPFWEKLGATVLEYIADTDNFGTFSGEVERQGSALECARRKCELSLGKFNEIDFALASEGSFGPHPFIPFLPCDYEILYFIDRKRDFHLHLSYLSEKTNYRMRSVNSLEELHKFANEALFPSHALILRPNSREAKAPLFKGIESLVDLEAAFSECYKYSSSGSIWVETDMRAQFNPLRMEAIRELAARLADRLGTHCPKCDSPGWGQIRQEHGLECSWCGTKTELIKSEIWGCVKCEYEETAERSDGLKKAEPSNCQYCNP